MQEDKAKIAKFKDCVGKIVKKYREQNYQMSMNDFAYSYDFGKGNISRIERGILGMNLTTAYRLSEALGISFVEFAQALQDELGADFSFYDD